MNLLWVSLLVSFLKHFSKTMFTLLVVSGRDDMSLRDDYRARAAEFRAKAERQSDPLFRSMFERVAKTYSRLAELNDRDRGDAHTKLAPWSSSPPADQAGR